MLPFGSSSDANTFISDYIVGYYAPFLLLPMYAASMPQVNPLYPALLLTILGCSNTIGRIIAGVIGNKPWVDCLILNNIALIIAGGSTMALPFCESYELQALFAVVFGVCVGKNSTTHDCMLSRVFRVVWCILHLLALA